jgi:hypothetical protein
MNSLQLIIRRLNRVFGNWLISLPAEINRNDVYYRLESLPEETRQRILKSFMLHQGDSHFESMVVSMLHKERSPAMIEDCLYVYDNLADMEMATLDSDWHDYGYDVEYGIVSKMEWVLRYNGRLDGYSFREEDALLPLREHDEKTRAQVVALIDFTNFLAETGEFLITDELMMPDRETLLIRNTQLAQLLVDKASRYDEIMSLIKERKTLDPDLLRSVLDNSAQQMNSGVL